MMRGSLFDVALTILLLALMALVIVGVALGANTGPVEPRRGRREGRTSETTQGLLTQWWAPVPEAVPRASNIRESRDLLRRQAPSTTCGGACRMLGVSN